MANLIRFFERLFLVLLSTAFIIRVLPIIPAEPYLALFVFSEIVGVALILLQRRGEWTVQAFPVAIAFLGTASALLVVPQGQRLAPDVVSMILIIAGGTIALLAKLSLGRSFGVIPANRGVKDRGVYRFVRHPMYFGYIVNHIGFLLLYFSPWNAGIYLFAWVCLWLRTKEEEKFLLNDAAYREYSAKVRSRLIPGII